MAGLELIQAPSLQTVPGIVRAFTTRAGGCSPAPFDTLNLGRGVGDAVRNVRANRRLVLEALGLGDRTLVCAEQVHGREVGIVREAPEPRSGDDAHTWPEVDGLITRRRDVCLALFFADCVPVLLAADDGSCVGLAHAGWRGIAAGVVPSAAAAFAAHAAVPLRNIVAWIGPSIGGCCYEVGDEVVRALARPTPAPVTEWARRDGARWRVGLAYTVRAQLDQCGVRAMGGSCDCTGCRGDRFFSHRRDGGRTGRMAAIIARR